MNESELLDVINEKFTFSKSGKFSSYLSVYKDGFLDGMIYAYDQIKAEIIRLYPEVKHLR